MTHILPFFLFLNILFILEYRLIMLCLFQVYRRVIQLYIYMDLFFLQFFSHLGYYWVLSRFPCAIQVGPYWLLILNIRSDQSLSRVPLFATPWIAARQASLSITNSRSSLRLTSIESVMPSSLLILCGPHLLLPPIPPSIIVYKNQSQSLNLSLSHILFSW